MPDFWRVSGHNLLDPDDNGHLVVTDDFLRAYFLRPEMEPVAESNDAERRLHEALLTEPRRAVSESEIAALADPDAIENYRLLLSFRDALVEAGTAERCYLGFFGRQVSWPALFLDHLVHVVLRSAMEGCDDPYQARAGELFFRNQKVTLRESGALLADAEVVEMHRRTGGLGSLGQLLVEAGTDMNEVELDILNKGNGDGYWARSDRFDMVFDLTFGRPGQDALCRVMERWILHMLGVESRIHPVQKISDEQWRWHTGLDVEASAILNSLYEGQELEEETLGRLLALFRLEFADESRILPDAQGRPVYLALAMTTDGMVRFKPQNLLVNLPLAPLS
ncbi:DUF6352 family protein [Oceanibacterium hippocampi]|uniref:Uncharacterized protein n=1 Tax=Oceanibacterium hippocampi TaxID=745714 RepID=A0A1Y5THN6_9PROT|nr:DUF6352 family protein [Oceanibacterium hippocampi]SLN60548.1 hypothetical protein OCH7691_02668 [Oceanibacterium hippocampi]